MPNPSETWQHKFTFVGIIFVLLAYHHSHFLATTWDFTSFFTTAILGATHFFYSWAVLD